MKQEDRSSAVPANGRFRQLEYFKTASAPALSPHERLCHALAEADTRVNELRPDAGERTLDFVTALWHFAQYATKLNMVSRAQSAFDEIMQCADLSSTTQRNMFGGAVLGSVQLHQFEGNFPESGKILERHHVKIPQLQESDRCGIALLAAVQAVSADNQELAAKHLRTFGELFGQLNFRQMQEYLPWTRLVLATVDQHNMGYEIGVSVVPTVLDQIRIIGPHFHVDEFFKFQLEKARLLSLTGKHEDARDTVGEIVSALDQYAVHDGTLEQQILRACGYLLQKMHFYSEALRITERSLQFTDPEIDVAERCANRIQHVNILTLLGRSAQAVDEFNDIHEELEKRLPRHFQKAVEERNGELIAAEFARWKAQGVSEEFVRIANVYSALLMLEVQTHIAPTGNLERFHQRQAEIEFLDDILGVAERRQQLLIEEATLLLSHREMPAAPILNRLREEYPLLDAGSLVHARACYLIAIYGVRNLSESDIDEPLDVGEYLAFGQAEVLALREAGQFFSAAALLNLAAKFHQEYGGTEHSMRLNEEIVELLSAGGYLYSQAGIDAVSELIERWSDYNREDKVKHYQQMLQDIRNALK